jgi:hypothetical protein
VLKPDGWLLFSTHHPASDARRLDVPRYLDVELVDDFWKWVGTVRYYRRPLSDIVEALTSAGLAIEKLVEPVPGEAFRLAHPGSYTRLQKQPEFLLVLARPWAR